MPEERPIIVAKKRRLFNKIGAIPAEDESDRPLLSILLKITEEIAFNRNFVKDQTEHLERKIDEGFKALNKKISSISQIDCTIIRLDQQLQRLTKEISDLQIHALNGFSSLSLEQPYQHY